MLFSLLIFSNDNIIVELAGNMRGNCFNRLCQLLYNWIQLIMIFKSSRSQMFYKVGVLKNLAKLTWKHLRLITMFQQILQTFSELLFYRARPDDCFWIFSYVLLFFASQWTKRDQVFSIFENVLSRLSNVMNIINFATGKLYFAK